MTTRWFRFYAGVVNDPKVQRLDPRLFKTWVNVLCVAAEHNGAIPQIPDLAFALRMDEASLMADVTALVRAGLIDEGTDGATPHNWNGRQFQSDTSTERVKRFRGKPRNVSETPTETPPDTDTDTEQNRADARGAVSSNEYDMLESQLREAAGLVDDPSPSLLVLRPVYDLLEAGYDLQRDILPFLRESKARGKRASTWGYYAKGIEGRKAQASPVKPLAKVVAPVEWVSDADAHWRVLAERYRKEHGKDPPKTAGTGGMGRHFPKDWVDCLEIPEVLRRTANA